MDWLSDLIAGDWRKALTLLVSGGALWQAAGSLFNVVVGRRRARRDARELLERDVEPILKAADELAGKMRSLAEEDFAEFVGRGQLGPGRPLAEIVNTAAVAYLFAQFWCRLEIFRRDAFFVNVAAQRTGRVLVSFIRCLESRRVRLVDRVWQRALAESVMNPDGRSCIWFTEFATRLRDSDDLREWHEPLLRFLRSPDRAARQRLLQYGAIVHALTDTLDAAHGRTRQRPAYPAKLAKKTRRHLAYGVFPIYLPSVKQPDRYTGIRRKPRWRYWLKRKGKSKKGPPSARAHP